MDHLMYSLQSVVPLFALCLTGYILRRMHVIGEVFVDNGTELTFKLALPLLLFSQISNVDFASIFSLKLILFAVAAVIILVTLMCLIIPLFVRGNAQRGAMIHAIYRGNFAMQGVPLAINMFGVSGAAPTSMLLSFTIPVYNVVAVIVLTLFAPEIREIRRFP